MSLNQKQVSPVVKGMKTKGSRKFGDKLNWIQCDKCSSWNLFENSGLSGDFDEKSFKDVKVECRMCHMENNQVQWQKGIEKAIEEVSERVGKLEKSCDELKVGVDEKVIEVTKNQTVVAEIVVDDKWKKVDSEIESKMAVSEIKCEERMSEIGKTIEEMRNRVKTCESKISDFRSQWPTPIEGVAMSKKESANKHKISFAEKFKNKEKDTVLLIGDSLVRGVGKKLETESHMFTGVSKGGAKLEHIVDEVSKLEDREDRHLVVFVETNNIKSEGSELVLRNYEELIEKCKSVKK
jgi:hypothetical protein